jgi:hypothetical protein
MEEVLDMYKRPFDPKHRLVCFDERPKQPIAEARKPIPARRGQPAWYDYEYRRNGVANIFTMFEPLAGKRKAKITQQRTKRDLAECMRQLVDQIHPAADATVLVMDNLNTHKKASLYEAFERGEARRIADKLEIHYTPKHGSWLSMAETEISVLSRQCLAERMHDAEDLRASTAAWQALRDAAGMTADWRFAADAARIKLKRLYPSLLK